MNSSCLGVPRPLASSREMAESLHVRDEPVKRAADSSPSAKRSSKHHILTCSLKICTISSSKIDPHYQPRTEIKAGLPTSLTSFLALSAVEWSVSGEAVFHEQCWQELVKNARRRNRKNMTIRMSSAEQTMLKEAAKTVEKHDSILALEEASTKIVSMLRNAGHCIAFTGAGISTSAGIGDYRGKGGKWTEMDREAVTKKVGSLLGDDTNSAEPDEDDGVPYEDLRPTYTHESLVKLMDLGLLKYIISQNGDGLHELSGVSHDSLAELHGNAFIEVCERSVATGIIDLSMSSMILPANTLKMKAAVMSRSPNMLSNARPVG